MILELALTLFEEVVRLPPTVRYCSFFNSIVSRNNTSCGMAPAGAGGILGTCGTGGGRGVAVSPMDMVLLIMR